MTSDRLLFAGVPTAATILLHLGLVLALVWRWSGPTQVVAAAPAVIPIQAMLVSSASLQPKPKPKPKPQPAVAADKSPSKPKPKPEPIPAEAKSLPEKPVTPESPKPKETPDQTLNAEQLAALTRAELGALAGSDIPTASTAEPSLRDVVAATIRAAVINRWTRPPSARNGMVAALSIQLVPTGEVVGVSVLQSSGNTAFDRSAMTAVERVGRFPEVTKLDSRTFEANFRRFQLIFKPEDLRY